MLKPIELKKGIFYVGVNDRTKEKFENLWPLTKGVSYNSYLIADEKTVLCDTVDICYSDIFIQNLTSALEGRNLDYIVINHMEPDHSGSLGILKKLYPDLTIIGNKRTMDMVEGYYKIKDNLKIVEDNETLSIGQRTLQFFLTPMVHWPETMITYAVEDKTIFSGDAFGTFGALNGGIMDKQINTDEYWDEMIRYYSNIVGKFGNPVQKALDKLKNISVEMICSTHGPVWSEKANIDKVFNLYNKLSSYEAEEGVVIVYGSMYGNTEQMAEAVARGISEGGVKNIVIYNTSKISSSYILSDIFKYNTLVVGSPTYNNNLYPPVEALLSQVQSRDIKNRFFSYFGSFTWAGAAVRHLKAFAETSNFEVIGTPIEMKQAISEDIYNKCLQLGKEIAEKITKK